MIHSTWSRELLTYPTSLPSFKQPYWPFPRPWPTGQWTPGHKLLTHPPPNHPMNNELPARVSLDWSSGCGTMVSMPNNINVKAFFAHSLESVYWLRWLSQKLLGRTTLGIHLGSFITSRPNLGCSHWLEFVTQNAIMTLLTSQQWNVQNYILIKYNKAFILKQKHEQQSCHFVMIEKEIEVTDW